MQIPAFGVSPLFATVLPVGFAGGHGTAGGLTPTYKTVSYVVVLLLSFRFNQRFLSVIDFLFPFQLGFPNGGDFGLASATLGLVFSVVCGVMLVNIATHRGWVRRERIDTAQEVKISIRFVDIITHLVVNKNCLDHLLSWYCYLLEPYQNFSEE